GDVSHRGAGRGAACAARYRKPGGRSCIPRAAAGAWRSQRTLAGTRSGLTFPEHEMKTRNLFAVVVVIAVASIAGITLVKKPGADADFTEYPMQVSSDIPTAVAVGPDGSVWFTIDFSDAIGLIREGKLQRISKPRKSVEPVGIAVDAQGVAWFTDPTEVQISSVRTDGSMQSYPLGTPIARLARLAIAPDGAVWFAESTSFS